MSSPASSSSRRPRRIPLLSEAERTRGTDFAQKLVGAHPVARLADPSQGHPRGAGLEPPGRGGRDGAGAPRLCGRPADARRGPARPEGRRAAALGRPVRARAAAPSGARRFRQHGAGHVAAAAAAAPAVRLQRRAGRAPAPLRGRGGDGRRAARDRAEGARSSGTCASSASRRATSSSASPKAAAAPSPTISRAPSSNGPAQRWMVALSSEAGAPTLHEQAACRRARAQGRRCQPSARAGGAGEISRRADRQRGRPLGKARRGRGDRDPRRSRSARRRTRPKRRRSVLSQRRRSMRDIMGLMKQAQAMQQKLQDAQAELDTHRSRRHRRRRRGDREGHRQGRLRRSTSTRR